MPDWSQINNVLVKKKRGNVVNLDDVDWPVYATKMEEILKNMREGAMLEKCPLY